MSNLIRSALETRLNSIASPLPTAFENVEFTPNGAAFQRVNFIAAMPDDSALGAAYRREQGIMQVTLHYPQNTGAAAAEDKANAIRAWFPRGLSLSNSGQTVRILNTPSLSILGSDGQYFKIAISIYFNAEVFG